MRLLRISDWIRLLYFELALLFRSGVYCYGNSSSTEFSSAAAAFFLKESALEEGTQGLSASITSRVPVAERIKEIARESRQKLSSGNSRSIDSSGELGSQNDLIVQSDAGNEDRNQFEGLERNETARKIENNQAKCAGIWANPRRWFLKKLRGLARNKKPFALSLIKDRRRRQADEESAGGTAKYVAWPIVLLDTDRNDDARYFYDPDKDVVLKVPSKKKKNKLVESESGTVGNDALVGFRQFNPVIDSEAPKTTTPASTTTPRTFGTIVPTRKVDSPISHIKDHLFPPYPSKYKNRYSWNSGRRSRRTIG